MASKKKSADITQVLIDDGDDEWCTYTVHIQLGMGYSFIMDEEGEEVTDIDMKAMIYEEAFLKMKRGEK